jgi:hypothetical protein
MQLNRTGLTAKGKAAHPPTAPHSIEPVLRARPRSATPNPIDPELPGPAPGPAPRLALTGLDLKNPRLVLPSPASTNLASASPASTNPDLTGPASRDPAPSGRASIVPHPIAPGPAGSNRIVRGQPAAVQIFPGPTGPAQTAPGNDVQAQHARFAAKAVWHAHSPPVPANREPAARVPAPNPGNPAAPMVPALAPRVREVQVLAREVDPPGSPGQAGPRTKQSPQAASAVAPREGRDASKQQAAKLRTPIEKLRIVEL